MEYKINHDAVNEVYFVTINGRDMTKDGYPFLEAKRVPYGYNVQGIIGGRGTFYRKFMTGSRFFKLLKDLENRVQQEKGEKHVRLH